jgi:iron only hydrogenase large subunit-like protein
MGRSRGLCFKKFNKAKMLGLVMKKSVDCLEFPLKGKFVAMVAPSFVANFSYPSIVYRLKRLGFDKVVELTFGAKMINREYQKILAKSDKLWIASACPGIVSTIKNSMPEYKKNLIPVDSPMVAMAKICKKEFSDHKVVFISPCDFKKAEAEGSRYVDYVIDYNELESLFREHKIRKSVLRWNIKFDSFYNDYTKIFPLGGALAETAHLKNVLGRDEFVCMDGIVDVVKFLKKPKKGVRLVDCLFCVGGCVGGPHTDQEKSVERKRDLVLNYLKRARREAIPEDSKGLVAKAKGLRFRS